jgi:hypothetical protein
MREASEFDRTVGSLHLRSADRVLTIEGAPSPLRIAAFRGPALADEPLEPALDAIGDRPLQVVIGSLGDDAAHVETMLRALATLPAPTLIVMGGRDHAADLDAAMSSLSDAERAKLIDASGVRRVVIGDVELIPVAGAPDGRYARDDEACGLGASDVDAIASELGQGATRFLIGFAAPSPLVGLEGAEAGSALVHDLATRVGAHGGLYAWPDVPGTADVVIVPAIAGPPTLLSDGSRLGPGVAVIELSASGMSVTH